MWICPICQLTCNIMQNPPKKLLAEISDRLHCDLDQPCYLSPTGLLGYCLCAGNNDRKASFTDAAVGKAAAMSGSSSTKLVPARYLSTYLPLTRHLREVIFRAEFVQFVSFLLHKTSFLGVAQVYQIIFKCIPLYPELTLELNRE